MTPEDEKRLAEICASHGRQAQIGEMCTLDRDIGFLLRLFDEEKRARTEAEATIQRMRDVFAREHDVRIAAENALAEERAKREAAEGAFREYKEMTDDAICGDVVSERQHAERRAETAEARVAELENACQRAGKSPCIVAGTPVERVPEILAARVAELESRLAHCLEPSNCPAARVK